MATNFVQDGNVIEVVNGNADLISSGEPIVIGDIVGVAITDIPVGDAGAAMVSGVFLLPKLAADVIPMGKKVALKMGKFNWTLLMRWPQALHGRLLIKIAP